MGDIPTPMVVLWILKAGKSCEEIKTRYFDRVNGRIDVMAEICM